MARASYWNMETNGNNRRSCNESTRFCKNCNCWKIHWSFWRLPLCNSRLFHLNISSGVEYCIDWQCSCETGTSSSTCSIFHWNKSSNWLDWSIKLGTSTQIDWSREIQWILEDAFWSSRDFGSWWIWRSRNWRENPCHKLCKDKTNSFLGTLSWTSGMTHTSQWSLIGWYYSFLKMNVLFFRLLRLNMHVMFWIGVMPILKSSTNTQHIQSWY